MSNTEHLRYKPFTRSFIEKNIKEIKTYSDNETLMSNIKEFFIDNTPATIFFEIKELKNLQKSEKKYYLLSFSWIGTISVKINNIDNEIEWSGANG